MTLNEAVSGAGSLFNQSDAIVVLGPRGCLPNSEYIYTPNGVIQVKDIYEGMPIEGGYIRGIHKFEDDIYEVIVDSVKFRANGEHPLWIQKCNIGNNKRSFAPQWITIKNVYEHYQTKKSKESRWYIQSLDSTIKGSLSVGQPLAKLLGYLMSDGYFSETQSVKFTNVRPTLLQDVANLSIEIGIEYGISIKAYAKGNGQDLMLTQAHGAKTSPLKEKFRELGIIEHTTFGKIQTFVREDLVAFVSGYFNGDGCLYVPKNGWPSITFYTGIYEATAYQMQFILWRLGIRSHVHYRHRGKETNLGCWEVRVGENASVRQLIDMLDDRKYPTKFEEAQIRLTKISSQSNHAWKDGGIWIPITSITKKGHEEVVGWETNPSHEIILSSGLRTHNSGKSSIISFLINILSKPKYNFRFTILDIVGNLNSFENKTNVEYYLVDPNDKEDIDMILDTAFQEGNQMVVVDEADRYRHYETSKLSELVNVARNYNVGYMVSSRRTADLDKDFVVNANWIIIFKHTWPDDIERITDWLNVNEETVRGLKKYEFLLVHDTDVIGKYKLSLPKGYTIQTVREPDEGGKPTSDSSDGESGEGGFQKVSDVNDGGNEKRHTKSPRPENDQMQFKTPAENPDRIP